MGELADYLSSDACQRLFSPKVKKIIDAHLTEQDISIQWLPITILDKKTGITYEYYYLHFPQICDSLDEEASDISRWGIVSKPCSYSDKIKGRTLCNWRGSSLVLMSNNLKRALFQAKFIIDR